MSALALEFCRVLRLAIDIHMLQRRFLPRLLSQPVYKQAVLNKCVLTLRSHVNVRFGEVEVGEEAKFGLSLVGLCKDRWDVKMVSSCLCGIVFLLCLLGIVVQPLLGLRGIVVQSPK